MADDMMMAARIAELEGLARECGEQFRFYERLHRAKVIDDLGADHAANKAARRKAEVNRAFAERCERALA